MVTDYVADRGGFLMVFHQPFDLYYWFVNVFAGSLPMFLAIAFITIAVLSAMFRFSVLLVGLFFALFVVMLSVATGEIYILVLLIFALIIGWIVSRLFR